MCTTLLRCRCGGPVFAEGSRPVCLSKAPMAFQLLVFRRGPQVTRRPTHQTYQPAHTYQRTPIRSSCCIQPTASGALSLSLLSPACCSRDSVSSYSQEQKHHILRDELTKVSLPVASPPTRVSRIPPLDSRQARSLGSPPPPPPSCARQSSRFADRSVPFRT